MAWSDRAITPSGPSPPSAETKPPAGLASGEETACNPRPRRGGGDRENTCFHLSRGGKGKLLLSLPPCYTDRLCPRCPPRGGRSWLTGWHRLPSPARPPGTDALADRARGLGAVEGGRAETMPASSDALDGSQLTGVGFPNPQPLVSGRGRGRAKWPHRDSGFGE